jgi:fermentation-respiration switch protein FrsA (DUF1100 family)
VIGRPTRLWLACGLLALGALAYAGWLRAERAIVFPGSAALAPPGTVERAGGRSVWLDHSAGRTEAWWLPARAATAAGPALLYAHGNGELIDHWVGAFETLRNAGLPVLLVEYPGYGRSGGTPSQASVGAAMRAAYDWLAAQPGVDPGRVVGYGRSLGGGAVCQLARERGLAALVLESTFTSVRTLAQGFGLPAFLVRDPFDNLAVVRAFAGPILLLHGERDEVIPVAEAEVLRGAAREGELHRFPCGHNDCPRPDALVQRFLAAHGLLGPGPGTPSRPAAGAR